MQGEQRLALQRGSDRVGVRQPTGTELGMTSVSSEKRKQKPVGRVAAEEGQRWQTGGQATVESEDSMGVGGMQNSGSSSWEYPTNVSKAPAGAVQAGEKVTRHAWPCLEGLWMGRQKRHQQFHFNRIATDLGVYAE